MSTIDSDLLDLHDEALTCSRLLSIRPVSDVETILQIGAVIGATRALRKERKRLERLHAGNLPKEDIDSTNGNGKT